MLDMSSNTIMVFKKNLVLIVFEGQRGCGALGCGCGDDCVNNSIIVNTT